MHELADIFKGTAREKAAGRNGKRASPATQLNFESLCRRVPTSGGKNEKNRPRDGIKRYLLAGARLFSLSDNPIAIARPDSICAGAHNRDDERFSRVEPRVAEQLPPRVAYANGPLKRV